MNSGNYKYIEYGYIYKIYSIYDNKIYIGKTTYHIEHRLDKHMKDKNSVVYKYFRSSYYCKIEVIEKIDMNEDISYLLDEEYNIKNKVFNKYMYSIDDKRRQIKDLSKIKLSKLEQYYIYKYSKDTNYNLINRLIHKNDELVNIYLFLTNTNK